eukprot:1637779-Amphidinium_carterae.1
MYCSASGSTNYPSLNQPFKVSLVLRKVSKPSPLLSYTCFGLKVNDRKRLVNVTQDVLGHPIRKGRSGGAHGDGKSKILLTWFQLFAIC